MTVIAATWSLVSHRQLTIECDAEVSDSERTLHCGIWQSQRVDSDLLCVCQACRGYGYPWIYPWIYGYIHGYIHVWISDLGSAVAVSYTHLTLPTNREV